MLKTVRWQGYSHPLQHGNSHVLERASRRQKARFGDEVEAAQAPWGFTAVHWKAWAWASHRLHGCTMRPMPGPRHLQTAAGTPGMVTMGPGCANLVGTGCRGLAHTKLMEEERHKGPKGGWGWGCCRCALTLLAVFLAKVSPMLSLAKNWWRVMIPFWRYTILRAAGLVSAFSPSLTVNDLERETRGKVTLAAPQLLGQTGSLQEIAPSLDMGGCWGTPSGASCCGEGDSTLGHLGGLQQDA